MKEMNRIEVWNALNEAEMNERYYGLISSVCRWINAGVRLLLVIASAGSLAAVLAESKHQTWLTWLSFVAAFTEVILKPIMSWEEKGQLAEQWRKKWIDVRVLFEGLWRKVDDMPEGAKVDASAPLKLAIAIEKAKGYVPKFQWLFDKFSKEAAIRRLGRLPHVDKGIN